MEYRVVEATDAMDFQAAINVLANQGFEMSWCETVLDPSGNWRYCGVLEREPE